jgi:vancomycin permeability regulator SanA
MLTFRIPHMKKAVRNTIALVSVALVFYVALLSGRIQEQSQIDEARPADVILVLGAAEYRGRPSPVLKARLDHALELYNRKLAPRIMTTGGAGGELIFTEGDVSTVLLIAIGLGKN